MSTPSIASRYLTSFLDRLPVTAALPVNVSRLSSGIKNCLKARYGLEIRGGFPTLTANPGAVRAFSQAFGYIKIDDIEGRTLHSIGMV